MNRQRRLTYTERLVLDLLREQPEISYTNMSAELFIDRTSALTAVQRLEKRSLISKVPGRGKVPNRYVTCDEAAQ